MGDVIGSAEFELRATRDKLKKDLADAERDLKQATGQMEADANRSAQGISGGMNKIGAAIGAVIGFATAAAVAMLALGKASFEAAAKIDDASRRIGVSTDVLQEFEYVARRTGGATQDAEAAIDSFGKKLSSAAAGLSKADLDAFKALGFNQDDLRRFKSVEEALDATTDRISDLGLETDRLAAATKVGLGAMSGAFRQGGDAIADYRDEAHEAGEVMEADLIVKGARAQEQLEHLSRVVGVEVAESFVQLSDEIIGFTNSLAGALDKFNELLASYNRWKERASFTGDMFDDTERRALMFGTPGAFFAVGRNRLRAGGRVLSGEQDQRAADYEAGFGEADEPALMRQRMAAEDRNSRPARTPGRDYLTPVVRTPRERVDRSAEREARRAERVEQEIFRARQRLLDVSEGDLLTAQERFDLARDQLEMDREARDAEIESKVARGEINQTEAAQLRLAHEQADIAEDRILLDRSILEIREEELANAKLLSDMTADLLALQSGAARTADERRRIELEILEITQRQRRNALEQEINSRPGLSEADKAAMWAVNGRIEQGERDAVIRNNQGPLDAWRDASLKSAGEVQEAFENIAVSGLDALNDGLVDAIMNSRNLGEVFSNVAKQILADLLKISVRRGITEPLANALFPQGGASGGSFGGFGSLFASVGNAFGRLPIPGFATGVSDFSGGLAYVHQGEVLANLAPGTDVIPAHAVNALGGGKGSMHVTVSTNDDRFNAYVDQRAAPQAAAAYQGARNTVPADLVRQNRYTRGRTR